MKVSYIMYHSKLIDIFAAIKKRKSDAYLLLLGGGELQDTIKNKVEKLNLCDSVIFCGVRTDVNKYLCAMDAFVFPSTWEGLGIVAIEAQASGLECYLSRELPKEVEVTDAVTWFDVSENENVIANMIGLTKVSEETRYIRNKKNGGLSSARNAGLEIAKGELIVFIDSDDWIDANYIEKLYNDISESGADVAVPAFCISFENGDCAVDSRLKEITTYSKKEALEVFLFNGYLTPCVASKMWKKSLWQKIRCPEGKLFEDQYTTYKLLMLANKIVFDPGVYYYYFKRSGSIGHSSFSQRTYDLLLGIREQYQVITEAYPETTSTMKVARTVWELVFVNMMICSRLRCFKLFCSILLCMQRIFFTCKEVKYKIG